MNEPQTSPKIEIPCQHLRSKEMYYKGAGEPDDEFSSGIFWCAKTHEGFGPDGQPVGKGACCPGRSCYAG